MDSTYYFAEDSSFSLLFNDGIVDPFEPLPGDSFGSFAVVSRIVYTVRHVLLQLTSC